MQGFFQLGGLALLKYNEKCKHTFSAAGGEEQRRMKSGGRDRVRKRRKEKSNIFSNSLSEE